MHPRASLVYPAWSQHFLCIHQLLFPLLILDSSTWIQFTTTHSVSAWVLHRSFWSWWFLLPQPEEWSLTRQFFFWTFVFRSGRFKFLQLATYIFLQRVLFDRFCGFITILIDASTDATNIKSLSLSHFPPPLCILLHIIKTIHIPFRNACTNYTDDHAPHIPYFKFLPMPSLRFFCSIHTSLNQ